MNHVILSLGSNLGDRRLNLSRAVRGIEQEFGMFEISHVVESEPDGFDSRNKFLNMCMMVQTELSPEELLAKLQKIEQELSRTPHRNPDGTYADREIDIDIIAIDDLVVESEKLTIPHPRLAERRFFLEPLAEIASGWRHPKTGMNADEMLHELARKNPDA